MLKDGIPKVLTVGDAASFTVSDRDFPATTWDSKIVFKDEAGAVKKFDGAASGDLHLFELSNAETGTLVAGANLVCLQFTDGSSRQSTDWTDVEILPDPATGDKPSFAQQMVTTLQEVIGAFNSSEFEQVNFSGQSFTRAKVREYEDQLTNYLAQVIQEKKAARAKRGLRNYRYAAPEFVNDGNFGNVPSSTIVQ